tara:strand:- start:937 stop:1815 length:879 start_codon:yes stop_codon:yes gene_type:complete
MPKFDKMKKTAKSGGLNFGERTGLERAPFPAHSGVAKGPLNSSPNKDLGLPNILAKSDTHKEAIKKDPRYGKLSSEEYKTEAARQLKHFKASGNKDWDAMGEYDAEGKRKKKNIVKIEPIKPGSKTEKKEPELIKPTKTAKEAIAETKTKKPEKKGWWQRYKDYRKTREFAETKDAFETAGNIISGKRKFPANAVEKFDAREKVKADEKKLAATEKRRKDLDDIAKSQEKRKQEVHDITYNKEQLELDRQTQLLNNRIKRNRISDWNKANAGDLTLNPSGTFAEEVVKKHAG